MAASAVITKFAYLDDLHLVRHTKGQRGVQFVLSKEYRVSFNMGSRSHVYYVPGGTVTDFASIPKLAQGIVSALGNHIEAAVVHDHMCYNRPWTSKTAANIFNEAMRAGGVPAWKRIIMYRAVLHFGPQWGS